MGVPGPSEKSGWQNGLPRSAGQPSSPSASPPWPSHLRNEAKWVSVLRTTGRVGIVLLPAQAPVLGRHLRLIPGGAGEQPAMPPPPPNTHTHTHTHTGAGLLDL